MPCKKGRRPKRLRVRRCFKYEANNLNTVRKQRADRRNLKQNAIVELPFSATLLSILSLSLTSTSQ